MHEAAIEAQPRALAVRGAGVRDRRDVDVDADRARSHGRQQRGAVALAARGVEHAPARDEAPRESVAMPVLVGDLAGTPGRKRSPVNSGSEAKWQVAALKAGGAVNAGG